MVEAWEVLSDAASVGQLAGLNVLELIVLIGKAANNVRMHGSKCLKFSRWLELQQNVLKPIMADAAWMKNPDTKEILEDLENKLIGAWDLVESCNNRNYVYQLVMGSIISRQLKESRDGIEESLRLIPIAKIAVESKDKMAAVGFEELLREAQEAEVITNKTTFKEFAKKYGNDERFKDLDLKERKRLFKERVDDSEEEVEEEVENAYKLMLWERGDINSNSHWSRVCDSLGSDPRYKALTMADREALFDEHVAEMRSVEQNTESTAEAKSKEEMAAVGFEELLREAQEAEVITNKTTFKEFAKKYGNDERFKDLDRKERKRLFKERVDELEEAKAAFKLMLRERGDINSNSHWSKACDSLGSDPRYKAMTMADREALFDEHVAEMRSAEQNTKSTAEAKSKEEVVNNAKLYMHKGLGKMQHQVQKLFKYQPASTRDDDGCCKH